MPKFRKKPVVIEAVHFTDNNQNVEGVCNSCRQLVNVPHIHTLEGIMKVSLGDWIIKGVHGEHYACKPDIFDKTYEAVTDEDN